MPAVLKRETMVLGRGVQGQSLLSVLPHPRDFSHPECRGPQRMVGFNEEGWIVRTLGELEQLFSAFLLSRLGRVGVL